MAATTHTDATVKQFKRTLLPLMPLEMSRAEEVKAADNSCILSTWTSLTGCSQGSLNKMTLLLGTGSITVAHALLSKSEPEQDCTIVIHVAKKVL